jgi:effector-binding domain-containing protein
MTVVENVQLAPPTYSVITQKIDSVPLAIVQTIATNETLHAKVAELLSQVWTFVLTCRVPTPGHNVVLYPYGVDENPALPFQLEVGMQIAGRFNSRPPIIFSSTPDGIAATTAHIGAYEDLPKAHEAIRKWCKENKFSLAGPVWEVYGHWHDDLAQRRTDVYYLLM